MRIPKRWLIVGSCGIEKTRANLYLSGQVRYRSMSEAESASPPWRRGRNCSSEGSRRAAIWARRAPRSRSSPITYSSSAEASIAARCSGDATRPRSSLIAATASGAGSAPGRWISAASFTSSR